MPSATPLRWLYARFAPPPLREFLRNSGLWGWVRPRWRRACQRIGGRTHFIRRRLHPISRISGFDRGVPIDRYYIERFLAAHAADISGRVLEFGDDRYTLQFGGGRVTQCDVLEYAEGNSKATIVADLAAADQISSDTFDCIICTQTLQMIFDVRAAVFHLHRILRPGGVLLATTHGTAKICRRLGRDDWGEYWRFTGQSAERLFGEVFQPRNVNVEAHGNVFAASAFLYGFATEELKPRDLDYRDPDYELLITIRAMKSTA